MRTFFVLLTLVMLGCNAKKDASVEPESPVQFNNPVCADAISEVVKLNGRAPLEIASKIIELLAPKPESVDSTTSCLDAHVRISCSAGKCSVAKRNI